MAGVVDLALKFGVRQCGGSANYLALTRVVWLPSRCLLLNKKE
jgi:hypothetical protein